MKPNFDEVLNLIDEHGEPKELKHKDCEICEKIISARNIFLGKAEISTRRVYEYKLTNLKTGSCKKYYSAKDLRVVLKVGNYKIKEMHEKGKVINGYKLERSKFRE